MGPGSNRAVRILRCSPESPASSPRRADDQSLEEIVVTGTRIARPNFEAASPIVAVPAAAFERTASGTAETTLNRYPQFVPSYTGTSNNSGGYSEGQASLNLRGLGDNRTLTLVDGRRLMPVNGNGETDLNVIPPALIESVEIVTGGALGGLRVGCDRGRRQLPAAARIRRCRARRTLGSDRSRRRRGIRRLADGRHGLRGWPRIGHRLCRLLRSCPDQSAGARLFAGPICSTSGPATASPVPATPTWASGRV